MLTPPPEKNDTSVLPYFPQALDTMANPTVILKKQGEIVIVRLSIFTLGFIVY